MADWNAKYKVCVVVASGSREGIESGVGRFNEVMKIPHASNSRGEHDLLCTQRLGGLSLPKERAHQLQHLRTHKNGLSEPNNGSIYDRNKVKQNTMKNGTKNTPNGHTHTQTGNESSQ